MEVFPETLTKGHGDKQERKWEPPTDDLPVRVFIRVRPLVEAERRSGHEHLEWKHSAEAGPPHSDGLAVQYADRGKAKSRRFKGFDGIFHPEHGNADVYEKAIAPLVPRVAAGLTACAFAYGHTGSGKTHTMIGYGKEGGMYRMAARALCNFIAEYQQESKDCELSVGVRFFELYQGKVKDLLGGYECSVREDEAGRVHVRGPTLTDDRGRVTVQQLKTLYLNSEADIVKAVESGLKRRNVGSSTHHDLSSRSHAVVELEIASSALIAARQRVIEAESNLVPVGKARDEEKINSGRKMYEKFQKEARELYPELVAQGAAGFGEAVARRMRSMTQEESRAFNEGVTERFTVLDKEAKALEQKVAEAKESLAAVIADGPACLAGRLVVVDLAGNEYAADEKAFKCTPKERAERKQINMSLLTLKECIRGLHSGSKHVAYRRSKLTMLLRDHMEGEGSCAVMIATMSPSNKEVKKTLNTLDYSQLIATA